jgi:hypothetical protein
LLSDTNRISNQISPLDFAFSPSSTSRRMDLERLGARPLLRLIDGRMRQWPGVINDGAQVAYVNPPAAVGASDVIIRCVFGEMA